MRAHMMSEFILHVCNQVAACATYMFVYMYFMNQHTWLSNIHVHVHMNLLGGFQFYEP